MAYLLISVACSVLVSVLLKLMQRRGIDTAQGITWNYLAASLLCFGLLDPPLAALGHADTPWAELALLALLLPGIFLVLMILSVNILGDGLRDSLDPKFSKRSDK